MMYLSECSISATCFGDMVVIRCCCIAVMDMLIVVDRHQDSSECVRVTGFVCMCLVVVNRYQIS
jgi:hypothetical protein